MASSLGQSVGRNLECPVCLGFLKDHKILECSHTFCRCCLEVLLGYHQDQQSISCPVCQETTQVPDGDVGELPMSIVIQSLIADLKAEKKKEMKFSKLERAAVTLKRSCKCEEHLNGDEECFCVNCGKYICFRCGIVEHLQEGHTVMEAERHKDTVKRNVDELLVQAAKRKSDIEKFIACIAEQRETCKKIEKQLHGDINQAFEKYVEELMERREFLKSEGRAELEKIDMSLLEMEKESSQQIAYMNKVSELVSNGLRGSLQKTALKAHKTLCEELEKLLNKSEPDQMGLIRLAKQSEHTYFEIYKHKPGNMLGYVRQGERTWTLVVEKQLPTANSMNSLAVSPVNTLSVGRHAGGIVTYSVDGSIQGIDLKNVLVRCLQYRSDCCYIVRSTKNKITLYTPKCKKLALSFFTLNDEEGGSGGFSQDRDGNIFIGYRKRKEIHMFKAEGGSSVRKIRCDGYEPLQILSLSTGNRILVKDSNAVKVIDSITGTILHSVIGDKLLGFPCLGTDDSILIAWVNHKNGEASISLYTNELKMTKTIINGFKFPIPERKWYYLQTFKSGELAFCTPDRLYIFRELST